MFTTRVVAHAHLPPLTGTYALASEPAPVRRSVLFVILSRQMASGYDIVGLALGALGVLTTGQLIIAAVSWKLPSRQMKKLDETLEEAEVLFREAVDFNHIPPDRVTDLEIRLLEWVPKTKSTLIG